MIRERAYDSTNKAQVLGQLRREIHAARMKVVLDEQLGRETSPVVLRLSKMKVPPTDAAAAARRADQIKRDGGRAL